MSGIQTSIDDHTRVATVALCEPERRNAISHEMADQVREAFGALEADERVGAVVVTGVPPAFCAGAVLGDLAQVMPTRSRSNWTASCGRPENRGSASEPAAAADRSDDVRFPD